MRETNWILCFMCLDWRELPFLLFLTSFALFSVFLSTNFKLKLLHTSFPLDSIQFHKVSNYITLKVIFYVIVDIDIRLRIVEFSWLKPFLYWVSCYKEDVYFLDKVILYLSITSLFSFLIFFLILVNVWNLDLYL